ncbi:MAG: hypothetical protein GYB35_08450 [Algicola sp.]|nr:hypothetical protein [Algicola sp.]
MTNQKLRIGLLTESYHIPFWAYRMVEIIEASSHSEIVLIVKKDCTPPKKNNFISKLWLKKSELFFSLYTKFEKRFYSPNPDALAIKNLKECINSPEILIAPEANANNKIKIDTETITAFHIDVFIDLGYSNLNIDLLKASKYGIWSYQFGNPKAKRFGPPGVLEMLKKEKEVHVSLLQFKDHPSNCLKLYEAFYETDNLYISRNNNELYWKSLFMVPKKLEELHRLGESQFYRKLRRLNLKPVFCENRIYKAPTNWETFKGITKTYWSAFNAVIKRRFYFEQWILLYKIETNDTLSKSFESFIRLLPPKDRFWADPFIIYRNEHYYIFIEELLYSEDKGKISVIEMDQKGNYSQPKVVLEKPYHLSYPFLIEDQDELYMLPETNENNTIELYKCIEFPNKWELEKVLINNIKAVDSTIYRKDGKFWMFTNVEEYLGLASTHELHIFYSDSLLDGNWIPHPENPVEYNHNNARPAGNIFSLGDKVFRPAQDCSVHYGYGMNINEIKTLNEDAYEEEIIESIHPNWNSDMISTHTINHCGNLTCIDAKISRRK